MKARWFFGFFLVSGFCSLVYEVVWLRLAMAAFGVTTPMVSIVLSVFMAGLAVGSIGAGRLARRFGAGGARTALRLYAACELAIGLSGLAVPHALQWGRDALAGVAWGSAAHHLAAGACVGAALLPFCAAMGATLPLAMAALEATSSEAGRRSFSYLYLANVVGAAAGTLVSALFLIELFGFRGTLLIAALCNASLALVAFLLGRRASAAPVVRELREPRVEAARAEGPGERSTLLLLLTTGLLSLAMEVVWVRQFTPYLGTVVYAFATILALYLAATFCGSIAYRRHAAGALGARAEQSPPGFWLLAGLAALAPLLAADPRLGSGAGFAPAVARVVLGIGPFCFVVGWLTPLLVDRFSRGDPERAGAAYAVNVVGSILGPLVASFVLLPAMGERWVLSVLAVPLLAVALWIGRPRARLVAATLVAAAGLVVFTRDFETAFASKRVLRDSAATVIAAGEGMHRVLLVNGYGMTTLTPVTKMMAHLPLAFHGGKPRRVLVICFGIGTTFRSSLSWGVPTTAVELIPSVPALFPYFHADAEQVLASAEAEVVVDDGRRYLERSRERYDVITVDPPPPVEAAGSSLLYSREFFEAAKARLAPDGILQHWFSGQERLVLVAVARAMREAFPHVRAFYAPAGGLHLLASQEPIPLATSATLAGRTPPRAALDLVEWEPGSTPLGHYEALLAREVSIERLIGSRPGTPALTDDRPLNEYYLTRRLRGRN